MKKLFILILILFPLLVHGENLKLSELTAVTSAGVESEDLLLVTINPTDPVAESDGGTRASRKVTLGNLLLWIAAQTVSVGGTWTMTTPVLDTPTFTLADDSTLTLPPAAVDAGWSTGLLGCGPDGTCSWTNLADIDTAIPYSGELTTEQVACWDLTTTPGTNLLKSCGAKTTDNATATHLLCKDDSGEIENCTLAGLAISGTTSPTITVEAVPSNATVNAAGEITIDTTTDQIRWYGTAQQQLSPKLTFSVVVPSVADTDDMLIMKAPYGMTITALDCIVSAATSATINIQECDSAGANCVDTATSDLACDTDGANTTTLNNAAVDSGDWLKLDVASISGTPGTLTVTVTYTIVAD